MSRASLIAAARKVLQAKVPSTTVMKTIFAVPDDLYEHFGGEFERASEQSEDFVFVLFSRPDVRSNVWRTDIDRKTEFIPNIRQQFADASNSGGA